MLIAAKRMNRVNQDVMVFQVMQDIHDHLGSTGVMKVFQTAELSADDYNEYVQEFRQHTEALPEKESAEAVAEVVPEEAQGKTSPKLSALDQFLMDD